MSHRTRRRRGHPRGKAAGFHGLRPAASRRSASSSGSTTQSAASQANQTQNPTQSQNAASGS